MITSLFIANRDEIPFPISRTSPLCAFVPSCETYNVSARGEGGNFLTRRHEDAKKELRG